jgi:hypothetical protein
MDNARAAWELPAVRTILAAAALLASAGLLSAPGRVAKAEEPAQELDRVRADPNLADDPATIERLARHLQSFAPGPTRIEARMVVAEAWLGRMARPDDAVAVLRTVVDDPEADPLTTRLAEREIVDALTAEGRLDDAASEAASHANRLDPRFVAHTRTVLRRRALRRAALVVLSLFAGLALASLFRALRRRAIDVAGRALAQVLVPAAAFAAYVAVAGGVLASQYESGNGAPFVLFGLLVLPLVLLARAWGAVGSSRPIARAARASLCAASVFAGAFILLDAVNPTYLEGFGL